MTSRTRIIALSIVVCHLFIFSRLFTIAFLANAQEAPANDTTTASSPAAAVANLNVPAGEEPVTIRAKQQEKAGEVYTLRGDAEGLLHFFKTLAGRAHRRCLKSCGRLCGEGPRAISERSPRFNLKTPA